MVQVYWEDPRRRGEFIVISRVANDVDGGCGDGEEVEGRGDVARFYFEVGCRWCSEGVLGNG